MISGSAEREWAHDVLLDLCFERGHAGVTVDALCRRAGIDRAAFGHRYTDLEGCFFEVHRVELERYRDRAAVAREGVTSWRGRLRATAYALYRFLAEDERLRHLIVVEARRAGERVRPLLEEELEALVDLIDEGRREPYASPSLTRATAEQVGGGICNQMQLAAGTREPMPAEGEIVPQMMYAAVLPYLGAAAAAEELEIPPPAHPQEGPPVVDAEQERIRGALVDLCHERGLANLTVAGLCRRAGVPHAAFERRFAGLEACFLDFYEAEMQSFRRRMAAAQRGQVAWRDRLRATAYDLFRFLAEDERRASFVVVESRAAGERAQLLFAEGIEPLFDLLDEGRAESPDPTALSRATAEQIGGGIFNAIYAAKARRLALSVDLVPQMMYAAVLPYLGAAAAAEELEIPPPSDLAVGGRDGQARG